VRGKNLPRVLAVGVSRPVSFLSEHSCEYVLVGDLARVLSAEYSRICPIFFWATREGTEATAMGVGSEPVRIITAFARRPKIGGHSKGTVLMKINLELFGAAAQGALGGCPVLAGVPLATGLLQFTLSTRCAWFHLRPQSTEASVDVEIQLDLDGQPRASSGSKNCVAGPLLPEDILRLVKSDARPLSWEEATRCIRAVRSCGYPRSHWFFTPGYRPFHLIVPLGDAPRDTVPSVRGASSEVVR
jgi:hypothetical protein